MTEYVEPDPATLKLCEEIDGLREENDILRQKLLDALDDHRETYLNLTTICEHKINQLNEEIERIK